MWTNTAKWLQEKAVDVAQRANVVAATAAEELRQSRMLSELETTSKALLNNIVGAVEGVNRGDDEALFRAIRLKYVTDRILAMAFPDPVHVVANTLAARHAGHFMIWNISEETYDYSLFENQVLEFKFPGHPAPPLGLIIKMCTSIENWLQADQKNVVVVHCLTGKGRTATVLSALLCWLNLDVGQGPGASLTTMQALLYISEKLEMEVDKVTIPSQRRYLQYFSNMVEGIKPRSEPLLLRRVIMNTIPRFGKAPKEARRPDNKKEGGEGESEEEEDDGILGCCPYLQLFKGGKLILTTPCSRDGSTADAKPASDGGGVTLLPWAFPSDGSIIFAVDCIVQGDILVRSRHLSASGQKISMFRAAFHTGYVPYGVLRLSKAQLDGACTDDRFDHDFFIDLIFAPADEKSRAPSPSPGPSSTTPQQQEGPVTAGPKKRELGVAVDIEDKDNYDAMLHTDTRFWNEIAARKKRAAVRARQEAVAQQQGGPGKTQQPAKPKFSIMGDGEEAALSGMEDDGSAGLVLFDNTPRNTDTLLPSPLQATSSSSSSSASAAKTTRAMTTGLISDEDLLQELEAAERAPVLHAASPLVTPSPPPPPSSSLPHAAEGRGEGDGKPPQKEGGLSMEMSALAELEKELGLDDLLDSLPTTSSTATAAIDFDDSLDDYEGFLESLGATSTAASGGSST